MDLGTDFAKRALIAIQGLEASRGLGYPFEYETILRNVEYYDRRSSHGSTLCRVVHAWVLARIERGR